MRQVQSLQSLQYLTILQNFYFCMWQMWWLISTLARYNLTQLQCQYFLALSCSAGRVSLESTLRHVQKCFENIDIFIMLSIFLSLRISQVKGEQTRSRKQFFQFKTKVIIANFPMWSYIWPQKSPNENQTSITYHIHISQSRAHRNIVKCWG